MKKITLFLMFLISVIGFAQSPIITMIADGDCSGGNPKVVELYADGTVDFANYSLEIQTNANTDWENALNLASLGVVTDGFVYIHKEDPSFATEFPSAVNVLPTTSSALNFNGDDRIRIVEDATSSVIDQYGEDSVDGTSEVWEYKDGYAKRNDGSGADGTFFPGNWSYFNGVLDGQGTCQGGTAFETIIGIGTYTTSGGSTDPDIIITSPGEGQTLSPGTTSVDIEFTTNNLAADDQVDITVNGTTTTDVTSPFTIENTTDGSNYSVTVDVISGGSSVASDAISFEIGESNQVANLSELRQGMQDGTIYEITGEVVITYLQGFRNQKYIQDASAAILIDDSPGNITTDYNVGDGLTGLAGTLSSFGGLLQFNPIEDPGAPTSTGNVIQPQVVTIADFNANFEDYEAELVAFENITFTTADGTLTFENGDTYPVEDASSNSTLVEAFFNQDYTGELVPTSTINIAGIAAEENNGEFRIFPRNLADIDITLSIEDRNLVEFTLFPNPVKNGVFTVASNNSKAFEIEIFNVFGKKVLQRQISIDNNIKINNLQSGIYLVKISQNENSITKKLIIK